MTREEFALELDALREIIAGMANGKRTWLDTFCDGNPLDRLIPGEWYMTFPTMAQAERVADALVNAVREDTNAQA
jgi:hypothetical protein